MSPGFEGTTRHTTTSSQVYVSQLAPQRAHAAFFATPPGPRTPDLCSTTACRGPMPRPHDGHADEPWATMPVPPVSPCLTSRSTTDDEWTIHWSHGAGDWATQLIRSIRPMLTPGTPVVPIGTHDQTQRPSPHRTPSVDPCHAHTDKGHPGGWPQTTRPGHTRQREPTGSRCGS